MVGYRIRGIHHNQGILSTAPDNTTTRSSGLFARLGDKLGATRRAIGTGLGDLLLGKREINADILEDIETILLTADVGIEVTQQLLDQITDELARKQLSDGNAVYGAIQQYMLEMLQPSEVPLQISADHKPTVILAVGVNGVGKTTTVGKLTLKLKSDGHKVMLAAADTFRAAAIEQLQSWGERNDVPVIAQHSGADAAAVAHDAYQAAQARGMDVLIVDTAGRQHTHDDLMQELAKIKRVLQKLEPSAPHEVLLVLDANTGQNALSQYEHFNNTVGITGLCLTKMDGTAKGGILLALAQKSALPIRFIGVGEDIEDLRTFQAREFIDALLPRE